MTVVGVIRERAPGERRVSLIPDGVTRLTALGLKVIVEHDAGASAWFVDAAYVAAGATIAPTDKVRTDSDILLCVQPPGDTDLDTMHEGQTLLGLLQPLVDPDLVERLVRNKLTAISLDGLPRTLSSAQSMDALTSQANVAGYKAVLVAANAYSSYLPMLMTAAGTVRPAKVLVIGAGVAGLQAIGTARRLGAVVTGFDVRAAAQADIASVGATPLRLPGTAGKLEVSADGYATALTDTQQRAQAAAMAAAIATFDIVITTAQVPGRKPPVLVSGVAVAAMRPGAVIVDLASGPLGGNVEGSAPGTTAVTDNGITIIGAGNLPAALPVAASTAYSRNVAALLGHLLHDGQIAFDTSDAITAGVLITRDGEVVRADLLALASETSAPQLASTG